jgi:hypothetical protein
MAMATLRKDDVAFYKDVHRFIAQRLSCNSARRNRGRNSFDCVQRLAPLSSDELPPMAAFEDVKCQDLSPGGFSFLSAIAPEHEDYVVELGKSPVLIYVTARVVHVSELRLRSQSQYLVGCRFTGRF